MKTKFTAVIVDDEPLSVDVIAAYLKPFADIEMVGMFTRSSEAAEKIPQLQPDLLLLDIQMPAMDGFELIAAITDKANPYIIFTTAYDQYAIKAFEVNAIGYLLKPFERSKFENAIQKFLGQNQQNREDSYENILKMLQQRPTENTLRNIIVRDAKKIFYIPVEDIVRFEASGDYVNAVTASTSHLVNYSLTELENKLDNFVRIHRSHLINPKQVKEFLPYFNGEYQIVMRNGDVVKMSRNYKDNLKQFFPEL